MFGGGAGRRVFLRLAICNLLAGLAVLALAGGRKTAEIWYKADANSLVGLQAFVEQRIDPDLYFDVVLPVVELPAWLAAMVLLTLFDALRLGVAAAAACALAAARRRIGR